MGLDADTADGFVLEGVSVRFGKVGALRDVSLRIVAGEQVGIVGPSGAGKTTLLRVVNGTLAVGAGRVFVGSRELAASSTGELRAIRSRIGFIHQELDLVPNLRVIQNVLAGRLGRRSFLAAARSLFFPTRLEAVAVHRELERVGVSEKLFERTDRLSGGEKQRVAIARALYQEPIALLADEPVASVDPARARDVVALLTELCRERGLTLCMSLHNLELARRFFPRLIGLRDGTIVFDRPSASLADEEFEALYALEG